MSRLLSINNYYYPRGGSEAVFFGHNRMLEDLGWDVVPFSMRHASNLATPVPTGPAPTIACNDIEVF